MTEWQAYSNANVRTLMSAIEPIKELPKPKPKELRKLKECYTDLVACCLKAGHLYLNAYYAGDLDNAIVVEGLTSILISMNKYYGSRTGSIQVSGIKKD